MIWLWMFSFRDCGVCNMSKYRRIQQGAGRPSKPNSHTYIIDLSAFFWDDEVQRVTNRNITISDESEMIRLVRWWDLGISDPYRQKDLVNHYIKRIMGYYNVKELKVFDERGVLRDYETWLRKND